MAAGPATYRPNATGIRVLVPASRRSVGQYRLRTEFLAILSVHNACTELECSSTSTSLLTHNPGDLWNLESQLGKNALPGLNMPRRVALAGTRPGRCRLGTSRPARPARYTLHNGV